MLFQIIRSLIIVVIPADKLYLAPGIYAVSELTKIKIKKRLGLIRNNITLGNK